MGRGSAGNIIAALASFFVPGLGQLVQGRLIAAGLLFFAFCLLWFFWLGWLVRLVACIDAAVHEPPGVHYVRERALY